MFKPDDLISILRETASITTRSSVVSPITYLILLVLIALIFLVAYNAPFLIIQLVTGIIIILVIFWMSSYSKLRRTDVNSLRSERHIRLMKAMDKGLIGDDLIGLIEEEKFKLLKPGVSNSSEEIDGEQE